MGPTWGPSGADRTKVGSMLAPWTLLSGKLSNKKSICRWHVILMLLVCTNLLTATSSWWWRIQAFLCAPFPGCEWSHLGPDEGGPWPSSQRQFGSSLPAEREETDGDRKLESKRQRRADTEKGRQSHWNTQKWQRLINFIGLINLSMKVKTKDYIIFLMCLYVACMCLCVCVAFPREGCMQKYNQI